MCCGGLGARVRTLAIFAFGTLAGEANMTARLLLTDIRQIPAVSRKDRAFEQIEQRQFAVAASQGRSKPPVDSGRTLKSAAFARTKA
jgi:hypothetical protein